LNHIGASLKCLSRNLVLSKQAKFGNARHSLVNSLKKNEVNRETIKDPLGHSNIHTIDYYFDRIEDEVREDLASNLLSISEIKKTINKNEKKLPGNCWAE
jgi:hypothetical protein